MKYDKSNTSKIYSLPKLYKIGIPLWPIILFIGASTTQFSKFLVNILSPLVMYHFSINNSKHFVRGINEIQCDGNHGLVSFVPDVWKIIKNF